MVIWKLVDVHVQYNLGDVFIVCEICHADFNIAATQTVNQEFENTNNI